MKIFAAIVLIHMLITVINIIYFYFIRGDDKPIQSKLYELLMWIFNPIIMIILMSIWQMAI